MGWLLLLVEPVWESLSVVQAPTSARLPHTCTRRPMHHTAACTGTRVHAGTARTRSPAHTHAPMPRLRGLHTSGSHREGCAVSPASSADTAPRPTPAQGLACLSVSPSPLSTLAPISLFLLYEICMENRCCLLPEHPHPPPSLPPSLPAHHLHPPSRTTSNLPPLPGAPTSRTANGIPSLDFNIYEGGSTGAANEAAGVGPGVRGWGVYIAYGAHASLGCPSQRAVARSHSCPRSSMPGPQGCRRSP